MKYKVHLFKLLHDLFWCVSEENVEVKDTTDGPVGHRWGGLQSHL